MLFEKRHLAAVEAVKHRCKTRIADAMINICVFERTYIRYLGDCIIHPVKQPEINFVVCYLGHYR